VTLKIFNSLGQEVHTLRDTYQRASEYAVLWDGRDAVGGKVASGAYFYTLTGGDFRTTKKMVLLR
jgi:flagellar hook assembly protein FlgD